MPLLLLLPAAAVAAAASAPVATPQQHQLQQQQQGMLLQILAPPRSLPLIAARHFFIYLFCSLGCICTSAQALFQQQIAGAGGGMQPGVYAELLLLLPLLLLLLLLLPLRRSIFVLPVTCLQGLLFVNSRTVVSPCGAPLGAPP